MQWQATSAPAARLELPAPLETAAELECPHVAALANDFEALVRCYRPRVFRFALASLRDPDAAESVTLDCFLRAYQASGRFRE